MPVSGQIAEGNIDVSAAPDGVMLTLTAPGATVRAAMPRAVALHLIAHLAEAIKENETGDGLGSP